MSRGLIVTIDGEQYRTETDRSAEDMLLDIQRLMRLGTLEELVLTGGHRMIVHWGRVTAVSVSEDDGRHGELTYSGHSAEPHWPERPF
jgi:hypothetical protein